MVNKSDLQTCTRSNTLIIDLTFAFKELNNNLYIFWEISEQSSDLDYIII